MASMMCKCGHVLSDTLAPNVVQLIVYTDKQWDAIIQHDPIDPLQIPNPTYDVWHCVRCDRVYLFDWKYGKAVKTYVVDRE